MTEHRLSAQPMTEHRLSARLMTEQRLSAQPMTEHRLLAQPIRSLEFSSHANCKKQALQRKMKKRANVAS